MGCRKDLRMTFLRVEWRTLVSEPAPPTESGIRRACPVTPQIQCSFHVKPLPSESPDFKNFYMLLNTRIKDKWEILL